MNLDGKLNYFDCVQTTCSSSRSVIWMIIVVIHVNSHRDCDL